MPPAPLPFRRLLGRVVLALLTLYGLATTVPDFARIVRPLGSFGLATNADGLIYDIQGPFATEEDSPAALAGLRVGDRLDLRAMRCTALDTEVCATNLALWGGVVYVLPGRTATLELLADTDRPAREVRLVAKPRPRSVALDIIVFLNQIAGVLVVLGAAYLVWIRPGPMTWGFFVYVLYFNPGQTFQLLAWLQQWPRALLAQNIASSVLQAAGYTGLILFALRAPVDRIEGKWRIVERALPALAVVFLAIEFASLGSLFGYRTEYAMRASLLIGFLVSAAALVILIARRKDLSPRDYQRIRWVIWGCLIGLPANLIGEIWQETSLPASLFGSGAQSEDITGFFYLINGILCLFVVEALRRPTVVSVWIPLRRATVLGLLLSLPAFFIHEELNTINEWTDLPEWAWVLVASVLVFLISRLHEWTTEIADRLFDRDLHKAKRRLEAAGEQIEHARSLAEIERLLVEEPLKALRLASAAVFREEDGQFRRRASVGWELDEHRRLERRRASPSARPIRRALSDRSGPRRARVSRGPRSTGVRRADRQSETALRGRPLQRPRGRYGSGQRTARPSRRARAQGGNRLRAGGARGVAAAGRAPREPARPRRGARLNQSLASKTGGPQIRGRAFRGRRDTSVGSNPLASRVAIFAWILACLSRSHAKGSRPP